MANNGFFDLDLSGFAEVDLNDDTQPSALPKAPEPQINQAPSSDPMLDAKPYTPDPSIDPNSLVEAKPFTNLDPSAKPESFVDAKPYHPPGEMDLSKFKEVDLPKPQWQPRNDIDHIINRAALDYGLDPGMMRTFAEIESSARPGVRTGSYKGLFQLSNSEFAKYGGRGDIYDPHENARAAARKFKSEIDQFEKKFGRKPNGSELYMIHQQGWGGGPAHWQNPDQPAWMSMYSTGEGQQKGARWAKKAIWGNVPDDVKRQYGSVNNMTSGDFTKMWQDKYNRIGRKFNHSSDSEFNPQDLVQPVSQETLDGKLEEILGYKLPGTRSGQKQQSVDLSKFPEVDFEKEGADLVSQAPEVKVEDPFKVKMPFGIQQRDKLFDGEDKFFKANPHVAGMAAEDGKVILNPYSLLADNEKKAVVLNESARQYMKANKFVPDFQVTPEQAAQFKGTAYETDPKAMAETIAARILSGDPSAGAATPEQNQWVDKYLRPFVAGDKDTIVGGFTDSKQYSSFIKRILPDFVGFVGTIPQGLAAFDPIALTQRNLQKYSPYLSKIQSGDYDAAWLEQFRKAVNDDNDMFSRSIVNGAIDGVLKGKISKDDLAKIFTPPTPMAERDLYKVGTEINEYAEGLKKNPWFKAPEGYENSVGGNLGGGIGSLMGGLMFGILGRLPAAVAFTSAGSGEAAQRAIEYDKKERAAGRPGLTEDQITSAAILGIAPGATDIIPVEALLGRWHIKVPAKLITPLAKAIADKGGAAVMRILGQAALEGTQEGSQAVLQNLIGQYAYGDKTEAFHEVLPEAGIGAGVGGIAQATKELGKNIIAAAAGRKGGKSHYTPTPEVEPETTTAAPAGEAPQEGPPKPPPGKPIMKDGKLVGVEEPAPQYDTSDEAIKRTLPQQAAPQPGPGQEVETEAPSEPPPARVQAPTDETQPAEEFDESELEEVPTPETRDDLSDEDRALLRKNGWDDEDIDGFSDSELQAEVEDARQQFGTPVKPAVPDTPTAEPIGDLKAQVADMKDPKTPRTGVYLSKDNVSSIPDTDRDELYSSGTVVEDFDGKGGVLIARDEATAQKYKDLRDAGVPMQSVLGEATGAGKGKPADPNAAVVQVTDSEGNIKQETAVPPKSVDQTVADFEKQKAAGDNVQVTTPDGAVARRDELISQEQDRPVPTFEDLLPILPKDQEGYADVVGAQAAIKSRFGKDWQDLTPTEKIAAYTYFEDQGSAPVATQAAPEVAPDLSRFPEVPIGTEEAPGKADAGRPLDQIFVNIEVEVTDSDENVTVRVSAKEALEAADKRIRSLQALLECVSR